MILSGSLFSMQVSMSLLLTPATSIYFCYYNRPQKSWGTKNPEHLRNRNKTGDSEEISWGPKNAFEDTRLERTTQPSLQKPNTKKRGAQFRSQFPTPCHFHIGKQLVDILSRGHLMSCCYSYSWLHQFQFKLIVYFKQYTSFWTHVLMGWPLLTSLWLLPLPSSCSAGVPNLSLVLQVTALQTSAFQ